MRIPLNFVRNVFLAIFIVATLVTFVFLYREYLFAIKITQSPIDTSGIPELIIVKLEKIIPVTASIVTSLTALLGFSLTAILGIRKEKREARESSLSLKQKELEFQRTLLELEELKKKHRKNKK